MVELFECREAVTIAKSSLADDHYLFIGEEDISLQAVLVPLVTASETFRDGRGLLYLLGGERIP